MKRGTPFDWLIVGLGNPGKDYARTRHNVGEETITRLAARLGDRLKAGRDQALLSESRLGGQRVVLAFPLTFMNESGNSVGKLVRRYRLDDLTRLVIVHDELDLPPGVVRVKAGGGLAGHNGLRSITSHVHSQDYLRVRIGVGKPPSKEQGANHVLSRLSSSERLLLDESVQRAADAVETIVTDGVEAAMRQFNGQ
ncbi:aminoacyl-tRNA hydrolase [soil metagenome]